MKTMVTVKLNIDSGKRKHMRYERKVWEIDLRIVKNWQPPGIEPRASDISETVTKKSHEV